jgi:hypothetical protein
VKATAEQVLDISERFRALKRRPYLGQADGLVEDAKYLLPMVEKPLVDVCKVTGLTVPEPLFPDTPWRQR